MGDFILDKKFIFEISIGPFGTFTLPILLKPALRKLCPCFSSKIKQEMRQRD